MTEALDPQLAALQKAAQARRLPPVVSLSPEEVRERVALGNALCAAGPALASVEDVTFHHGGTMLGARVYRPTIPEPERVLVYFHGGGWVTGDLDYADEMCRFLARDAACTVVSIDYRLAPEHPFPQPVDDAWAGLQWVARDLAPGATLAVAGDSAGGNLAAACALRGRNAGGPPLAFLLLLYPVLDHDFGRPSYHKPAFPVGGEEMRWFWKHYAPDKTQRDVPEASPLLAESLAGLPTTHVVVAGHDPLHDEGCAFAARLRASGVRVTLDEFASLGHGFLRFTGAVEAAREAVPGITAVAGALFSESSVSG